jgi:hypothetical protein
MTSILDESSYSSRATVSFPSTRLSSSLLDLDSMVSTYLSMHYNPVNSSTSSANDAVATKQTRIPADADSNAKCLPNNFVNMASSRTLDQKVERNTKVWRGENGESVTVTPIRSHFFSTADTPSITNSAIEAANSSASIFVSEAAVRPEEVLDISKTHLRFNLT